MGTDWYDAEKVHQCDISEKQKIVIPARVLSILQKLAQNESITMSIDSDRRFVRFIIGNIVLDASLIIEPYPNYDAVIPVEHDKHLIIDRSMIYDSVRRVGGFQVLVMSRWLLKDNFSK